MPRTAFVFEVVGENAGDLRVRIELAGSQTLELLHREIANEFGFAPEREFSFFLSGLKRDARSEYGAPTVDAERRADKARVERLALRVGSRLRHVGDAEGARWHELRVVAIGEVDPQCALPRVVERSGTPERTEQQREAERVLERFEQEFDELAHELAARAGEVDDAPADEAWLRREFDLATRVLAWAKGLPLGLHDLESATDIEVVEWLLDLPRQLALAGLANEAIDLCALGAEATTPQLFLPERALLLAEAARNEEALAQADDVLARFGDDDWAKAEVADAVALCGDVVRAESLYRDVYARSSSPGLVADVGARLADLLSQSGRESEARAVRCERFERAETLAATPEGALEEQDDGAYELEPQPKVGRNDPCPCDSGKKFKKCCGARAGEVATEARVCAELTDELVRYSMREREWGAPGEGLEEFGGAEFRGLSIPEALPLMAGDSIEDYFTQWWLLDRRWRNGKTIAERFAARYRGRGDAREGAVLQRLLESHVALYRVERIGANGRVLLRDALDPDALPQLANCMQDGLAVGATSATRLVELDGTPCMLPGVIEFAPGELPRVLAALRGACAGPDPDWAHFLKRHAHLFHRLARDLALQA